MSEDEMDTDEVGKDRTTPMRMQDGIERTVYLRASIPETADHSRPPTERATTTEGSFHSAREEPMANEDQNPASQGTIQATEAQSPIASPKQASPKRPSTTKPQPIEEGPMQLDGDNEGSVLEDAIDESRSPSQGSSPIKPLVRKSSLTFAALPAREPLTTKKSIGARVSRTSHVDQAKNALNRGSFLGRFTSGISLGAAKHTEPNTGVEGGEVGVEEPTTTVVDREESDGDTKIAKIHNKSSTQRLHDKINMLGKSQPARPTKSIPASTTMTNPSYPELPLANVQTQGSAQRPSEPQKPVAVSAPEDDDDDWIKPPPTQSHQLKRPQLPKSTTADVMEKIRGKQNIGDEEVGPGYYDEEAFMEPPPDRLNAVPYSRTSGAGLARSASAAQLASPSRNEASTGTYYQGEDLAYSTIPESRDQVATSTTPVGTPRSKHNIDGPISASKSKLQSIMKTARGLFTSSAGVSAQAKIEALASPSTRTRSKLQESDISNDAQSMIQADSQKTPAQQNVRPKSPKKQVEGRKTRSSTEKEEKRKEQEAKEKSGSDVEANLTRTEAKSNATANQIMKPELVPSKIVQPSKPTRQSPRRLQKEAEARQIAEDIESRPSNGNGAGSEHSMGPPQAQMSLVQRPKDARRPMKPAKEAATKPRPQTIRVGALSQQRIPLSNAALSSSLQESLPAAQTGPSGLVKKASNASIQTSASNSSLKSSLTSVNTKPKALLAAERKKEQVSQFANLLHCLGIENR